MGCRLGAPLVHVDFIARELQAKTEEHTVLFRSILAVQDLQRAWLLLLFSAATRADYVLRVVQPAQSERSAAAHDENVWNCTQELLDTKGTVRVRQLSSLLLALGGLGLRSASRSHSAAFWASWADSLPRTTTSITFAASLVTQTILALYILHRSRNRLSLRHHGAQIDLCSLGVSWMTFLLLFTLVICHAGIGHLVFSLLEAW